MYVCMLKHHAAECKSKMRCQKYRQKHHTSICNQGDQSLTATRNKVHFVYSVVKVSVEGVLCHALLDTGAGSSYASAALLERLPKCSCTKIMLGLTTGEVELSTIKVCSTDGSEELKINAWDLGFQKPFNMTRVENSKTSSSTTSRD